MQIVRIGLDLAKYVFEVHGVDAKETVVLRKTLRRDGVVQFFSELPSCLVGLEACSGAHYWAKVLSDLGHDVRLISPQFVTGRTRSTHHLVYSTDPEPLSDQRDVPTHRKDRGYRPDHCDRAGRRGRGSNLLQERTSVRRLAGAGSQAKIKRRQSPAVRDLQTRRSISAHADDPRRPGRSRQGWREAGSEKRVDWPDARTAAPERGCRCPGEQERQDRMGRLVG